MIVSSSLGSLSVGRFWQYKGRAFKIALLDQWIVVITGKQLVEELSKIPEDRASFAYGVTEMTGMVHAFGEDVWRPPYHVDIMRPVLTRHIAPLFGEIYNEVETAFQEIIPAHKGGTCVDSAVACLWPK